MYIYIYAHTPNNMLILDISSYRIYTRIYVVIDIQLWYLAPVVSAPPGVVDLADESLDAF